MHILSSNTFSFNVYFAFASFLYNKTYISNLVRTTRFWNNLHHVTTSLTDLLRFILLYDIVLFIFKQLYFLFVDRLYQLNGDQYDL
jgi:hypothetical protein